MWKRSTPFKIVFFSLLLAGFIVIQYKWVQTLQKDRLEAFNERVITGIDNAMQKAPSCRSLYTQADTVITGNLRRSFITKGLGIFPFEFSLGYGEHQKASRHFSPGFAGNPNHLYLQYLFQHNGEPNNVDSTLTVVIPFWKKPALHGMNWIIASSVLLTIIMLVIFVFTFLLGKEDQQLFYDKRSTVLRNMLQQLEAPLSTVSVAAEALRNARVSNDAGKINYYQQVINEENKRMNEQVEKFLREMNDPKNRNY